MMTQLEEIIESVRARRIQDAMDLVVFSLEIIGVAENNDVIYKQTSEWYDRSDEATPEMLAAAVLEWGDWHIIDYSTWIAAKEKWFGENFPHKITPISVYEEFNEEEYYLG